MKRLKQIFPDEKWDVLLAEIANPKWDCLIGPEDPENPYQWEQYIPDDMHDHWNELSQAEQIIARLIAEEGPYFPTYREPSDW